MKIVLLGLGILIMSLLVCTDIIVASSVIYDNPYLPKLTTEETTTTTIINITGNGSLSDTNWEINTTVLQNESGTLGIVDSFFQDIYLQIVNLFSTTNNNTIVDLIVSSGFNNTYNSTYDGYAYNMTTVDSIYNYNQTTVDSIYNYNQTTVDAIWNYNQTEGSSVYSYNQTVWENANDDIYYDGDNVGINTSTPLATLQINSDVDGATAGASNLHLLLFNPTGSTAGEGVGIGFGQSGSDGSTFGAKIVHEITGSYSRGHLDFYTSDTASTGDNTELRMRISDSGNVSIGTTQQLGRFNVEYRSENNPITATVINASAPSGDGGTGIRIYADGYGGAGSAGTGINIDVDDRGDGTGTTYGIYADAQGGLANYGLYIKNGDIYTHGNTLLDGNLTIRESSSVTSTTAVKFSNPYFSDSFARLDVRPVGGDHQLNFFFSPSGVQNTTSFQMRNQEDNLNSGRLILQLDNENAYIKTDNLQNGIAVETLRIGEVSGDTDLKELSFWAQQNKGFQINGSDLTTTFYGDIGIGTESPSHELTVIGNVNVTGDIHHGGSLLAYSPFIFEDADEEPTTLGIKADDGNWYGCQLHVDKNTSQVSWNCEANLEVTNKVNNITQRRIDSAICRESRGFYDPSGTCIIYNSTMTFTDNCTWGMGTCTPPPIIPNISQGVS